MGVTKRGLLAWVTAAQAEKGRDGLWFYGKKCWFSVVIGGAVLLLAQLRIGRLVGLVWLMAPALAWAISRPGKKGKELPPCLLYTSSYRQEPSLTAISVPAEGCCPP